MDNPINGMFVDLINETANETNEVAGLETLLLLLDKVSGRVGLVTQTDRAAAVKSRISARIAAITARGCI
jgi:hypothetical protein